MGSSNENGGAWSMIEDVSLCEAWVEVSHCPVTGNEIKFSHMWKKIHQAFCERAIGSTRTEMALSSRWKVLNKELGKWRNALAKAIDNQRSGENLSNEIIQAQMWKRLEFSTPELGGMHRNGQQLGRSTFQSHD
ncbi:hypothetical protein L3X38_032146 [Prunus dulcis]|uniref:Nucleotide-diphospho-sugar transferases superfamily protein n=1 Tax=Prunus dulcis TaxID=3755 RepID=A0AAD4VEY4_PRUDU|nr:hypothetical protein L3X38_032146 [Prunus dulcis]